MCLITEQKTAKIATKDLIAFKLMEGEMSPYSYFKYKMGKLYKTKIKESDEWCCFDDTDQRYLDEKYSGWTFGDCPDLKCFGSGFHSSLTKKRLLTTYNRGMEIHKCIIPKGSKYYKDATGLIISNQIIVN